MPTSVKFFHSSMAGAPQVSGTIGALISVLDAVLVDGFGLQSVTSAAVATGVCTLTVPTAPSAQVGTVVLVAGATPAGLNGEKRVTAVTSNTISFATTEADTTPTGTITVKVAPAGWVKAFTGTNKAAYKIDLTAHPDSPAMLCRFDDTTTLNAKIIGYESMSDVDTGVGPFPTTAQTNMYVFKSSEANSTTKPWLVVADDQFVYVGIRHYSTTNIDYGMCWFGFGEFSSKKSADPYRFMVTGGASDTATQSPAHSLSIAGTANETYVYAARSYTGLGAGVKVDLRSWPADYGGSGNPNAPLAYPNPSDYGLYLCPADIFETGGSNLRGRMPGMLLIPHSMVRKICPDAATAYLDSDVPAMSGKTVGFMPCTYSASEWAVVAFDLTGPWEH